MPPSKTMCTTLIWFALWRNLSAQQSFGYEGTRDEKKPVSSIQQRQRIRRHLSVLCSHSFVALCLTPTSYISYLQRLLGFIYSATTNQQNKTLKLNSIYFSLNFIQLLLPWEQVFPSCGFLVLAIVPSFLISHYCTPYILFCKYYYAC